MSTAENRHPEPHDDTALAATAAHIAARRYVERRLAELPAGPRDAQARLRGLRGILEEITRQGHPDPLALLAGVLGIPVDTLVIHLRAAGRAS